MQRARCWDAPSTTRRPALRYTRSLAASQPRSRKGHPMRSVVVLAVIVLLSAVLVACGGSAAAPTATPAATVTAAASTISPATATQPPMGAVSGQLAFAGMPEGASASAIYLVGRDGAGLEAIWTWETA